LSRRDADDALEVVGELALIREADARRDLSQGEVTVWVQERLRPRDAARDDVLVRRHPGGRFELPREVVGAEVGGRRHLRQGQTGVEVGLDGFCRKFRFLRQNLKTGCQKFNDLQTSKFPKKQICDRTRPLRPPGRSC
jgi:hypothetical protein